MHLVIFVKMMLKHVKSVFDTNTIKNVPLVDSEMTNIPLGAILAINSCFLTTKLY